jgi:hypothetical protein
MEAEGYPETMISRLTTSNFYAPDTLNILMDHNEVLKFKLPGLKGPPLWSSGQSSWLQIRRPGFDSRHYQKKKVVGLELGPLSLVSTTEELLDRKVAAPV